MIDPTVQLLLERAIDSPVKLHILLIFHEHPRLEVTPSAMAERCCRDIWSVSQALHELAEDGILQVSTSVGLHEPRYCYMPRPEYLDPIHKLMRGYDDPLERDLLQRSLRDIALYASFRRNSPWDYQNALASWDYQNAVA